MKLTGWTLISLAVVLSVFAVLGLIAEGYTGVELLFPVFGLTCALFMLVAGVVTLNREGR